jgi:hypothetical protein
MVTSARSLKKRDSMAATASPSASMGNIVIIGILALLLGSPLRAILSASLFVATTGGGSGQATRAAGASAAWSLVGDDVFFGAGDTSPSAGVSSRWTGSSPIEVIAGAISGLTAGILTFGEAGSGSPELTDIGALSAADIDLEDTACRPSARKYQHLRCVAQSNR